MEPHTMLSTASFRAFFFMTVLDPTYVSELMTNKQVTSMVSQLVGLGERCIIPPNLSLLVLFAGTGVQQFDLIVSQTENNLDVDDSAYTWQQILQTLKAKFDELLLTKHRSLLTIELQNGLPYTIKCV